MQENDKTRAELQNYSSPSSSLCHWKRFISLTPLSDVTPSPKTLHGYFAGVTLAEQSLPKPFLQAAASASEQPNPITLSKL